MNAALVKAIWDSLPDHEKQSLIQHLVDLATGKPSKAVRIAQIRLRKIKALARVEDEL